MTSQQVKQEILNGIFRSKDGLSTNELTELLNTLIEVAKREGERSNDAFTREIIVRANLDLPLNDQELDWWNEGTDVKKCPELFDKVMNTKPIEP